jgi:hypothetical protein
MTTALMTVLSMTCFFGKIDWTAAEAMDRGVVAPGSFFGGRSFRLYPVPVPSAEVIDLLGKQRET